MAYFAQSTVTSGGDGELYSRRHTQDHRVNTEAHRDYRDNLLLSDTKRDCFVTYIPSFLARSEADSLFAAIVDHTPFVAESPVMFGRKRTVLRETFAYGDSGVRYRYSGIERIATQWTPALSAIAARVSACAHTHFNFALCNHYPDGRAGLGWHADNERDLVRRAPIASLSLGAERDFQVRLGRHGKAVLSVPLAHGSLLLMHGAIQEHYQHRVPKRARCTTPRVNLTFRAIVG